jgi:hypothetical protein
MQRPSAATHLCWTCVNLLVMCMDVLTHVAGLWIRIGSGFRDFVDPDPYWESGSRGKKPKKFQWKKCTF